MQWIHSEAKYFALLGGSRGETRYLSIGIIVQGIHEGRNSETAEAWKIKT